MWLAGRGQARVYILGVAGASNRTWCRPRIQSALAESKEFWREIPTGAQPSRSFFEQHGTRAKGSLFDDLSREETSRVLDIALKVGMTGEQLQSMELWYAAQILTFLFSAKGGRPIESMETPETVMSELAEKAGKPVKAECATWEDFITFFDKMPVTDQKQYLSYNLDSIERGHAQEQSANEGWEKGDSTYLEKGIEEMRRKYPDLYTALNVKRNAEWVLRTKQFLSTGGTYFILVGINHTLGPNSIQLQLKQNGIAVSAVST